VNYHHSINKITQKAASIIKKEKPLIDSGEWELYIGGPIT